MNGTPASGADAATLLRQVREGSGLSLRALARRAATSRSALAAYEAGRKTPTAEALERILTACGMLLGVRPRRAIAAAARGTIDIDVNVLVGPDLAQEALAALPKGVTWQARDVRRLRDDGQARVWWERVPVDVFFNTKPYQEQFKGPSELGAV